MFLKFMLLFCDWNLFRTFFGAPFLTPGPPPYACYPAPLLPFGALDGPAKALPMKLLPYGEFSKDEFFELLPAVLKMMLSRLMMVGPPAPGPLMLLLLP